jgi:predicted permease
VAEEISDELRFHIEGRARELEGEGWEEGAALEEAARRFGNVSRIDAECRALSRQRINRQRRGEQMNTLWRDLLYGVRTLRKNAGFSAIAVLTLGLGIGATTAIFTVVDGVLIRPLPWEDPDRLVLVWEQNLTQGLEQQPPSPPNFIDWREGTRSFSGLAALMGMSLTLTGVSEAEVLPTTAATANFFEVLRAQPLIGRTFASGEDVGTGIALGSTSGVAGAAPVVVLSYGTWQRLFAADPSVVGRTMVLNGAPFEVIGVMPPDFRIPQPGVALWVPVGFTAGTHRQARYLTVLGRLADGVSMEEASADVNAVAARLDELYPESNDNWRVSLIRVQDYIVGGSRGILLVVFAAVGFVLVLACVNVANLVLGRAIGREGELAVRTALGASRGRLRSQLMAESVLLGLAGGALGIALAYAGVRAFLQLEPEALPRAEEIGVDARILVFALVAAVTTGLLFGLIPGVRSSRHALGAFLREGRQVGSRRSDAIRKCLIVAEVALSLVLLVGAGLAIRSLQRLQSVDPGYDRAGVLAARISLDQPRYPQNADRVRYFERLLEQLGEVRGVMSAGVTNTLPLTHGIDFNLPYRAEGQPELPEGQLPQADYRIISPGYLESMGITVARGRGFTAEDRAESRRVLLINRTFADQLWPGQDPIGKQITIYYVNNQLWEVIGVVADTRHLGLSAPPTAQMFVPLAQAEVVFGFMTVVVRKDANATGVEQRIRQAATALDPSEPFYDFQTIEALVSDATARDRLAALVFTTFALLAIGLSAAGIYGVISYQVARRTREIGVRIALGAARSRVVSGVVAEAAMLAGIGILLGLGTAVAATGVASGWLYGISARDPLTFVTVSMMLLSIALVAAFVPAWRAASVHPVQALRQE